MDKRGFLLEKCRGYFGNAEGVVCEKQEKDGRIISFIFRYGNHELTYKHCWCGNDQCKDCDFTKHLEWQEEVRCKFSCNKYKKCPFCA
nr:hypothetical protein MarFTME_342 [Marseillevirus futianmevirus]